MKSALYHPPSTTPLDPQLTNPQISMAVADANDRDHIYKIRYQIYGLELGQHTTSGEERLRDGLDDSNVYLVGKIGGSVVGFISITPPTAPSYSIDKYFARATLPIRF